MKTFQCDHCQAPVFFENIRCLTCGSILGITPGSYEVHSVREDQKGNLTGRDGSLYRFCRNSIDFSCCNQLVPAGEAGDYCRSCQYTEITPDLGSEVNRELWFKLECAKRRLLYSLVSLGIAPPTKGQEPQSGLSFRFLVDNGQGIMTGHEDGIITITLAEADDATRESRRMQMGEDYRTLLGHFRHEVGHYYWDRLVAEGNRLESFREKFGDERADYQQALSDHYARPPGHPWQDQFISNYASSHPWEDWAETFAHFLHMTDLLETSRAVGLLPERDLKRTKDFSEIMETWLATSFRLNQLGRSIGSGDLYPFVLTPAVIDKMAYISEVITESAAAGWRRQ